MKFSETWLREWLNLKIDSITLCNQISDSGLEIECIDMFEPRLNGVLIGKVIQCTPHSTLKKLKVAKVDIGNQRILNIVCGAPNCRNGIKVAVATIGSILPNKLKINIRHIQGESSEGMLCSFQEIGLFHDNKIIEFSDDASLGDNISDYLSLKDNIIKINTTPNRPDGLSILGLARNISSVNNLYFTPFRYKFFPFSIPEKLQVKIEAKKQCINYSGRIIKNINIDVKTPFWMQKKLFLCDLLSKNIIENIINYVLIEFGQPLNVLNLDNIDSLIIVRMAKENELIVLKDNVKISLNKNILVFSDKNKILSIPGNLNADNLEINKDTKNIFLNTCLIDKQSIFHISKKIKPNKILDYYNHGIDPFLQNYAIEYATNLIIKICGGSAGPIINKKSISSFYSSNIIRLYYTNLYKLTGAVINKIIISNILFNLNYKFIFQEEYWDVMPPSWRFDILVEEDVINDILRIYGYDNICLTPLKETLNFNKKNKSIDDLLEKSRNVLVNKGYYEVITYGFINPKIHSLMFPNREKLLISNPISQEMSCMRSSLWPGLIKIVSYNKNRKQDSIRFFESGLCFYKNKKENLGIKQELLLGGIISGNYSRENWHSKIRKVDFYDLKGDLESLLESIFGLQSIDFRPLLIPGLHPEQSASVFFRNNLIGSIGAIDPRIEKDLNVYHSTFLFEISLNNLFNIPPIKIKEISKFPTSRRDISIVLSEYVMFSDIINECKKIFINKKVEINLFDVYSFKEHSCQKISLGISFIFQDEERTLTEYEITLMVDNCIGVLKRKFKVILRK